MASSDPLLILLAHDRWATRQILEACAGLSEEQFHRGFEMGPGSLHATATHMIAAMRGWGDLLAGREQRPRLDENPPRRSVAELLELHEQVAEDFGQSAKRYPVDQTVTATRGGQTYTFSRGGVVTHVCTHGMHHRAQCLNMLRHVGVASQPPSSVAQWMRMVDSQAPGPTHA